MREFRFVYAFLAVNFIVPTIVYAFAPDLAMAWFGQLNALLGGGDLPVAIRANGKHEVQRAIAADEDALKRLCANYIDNVKAYTQREKVKNKFTGQDEEPDERLMRSIEEKIDIPDSRKDDFRREIMNYIGALSLDGKKFDYKTNERLQKALTPDSIEVTDESHLHAGHAGAKSGMGSRGTA